MVGREAVKGHASATFANAARSGVVGNGRVGQSHKRIGLCNTEGRRGEDKSGSGIFFMVAEIAENNLLSKGALILFELQRV